MGEFAGLSDADLLRRADEAEQTAAASDALSPDTAAYVEALRRERDARLAKASERRQQILRPAQRIEAALAAARNARIQPPTTRGMLPSSFLNPGAMKSPEVLEADRRRARFIAELGPLTGLAMPDRSVASTPEEENLYDMAAQRLEAYAPLVAMAESYQTPESRKSLESAYDPNYGLFSSGGLPDTAFTWWGSVPGMAYEAARFAADLPNARENYNAAYNTFMMPYSPGYGDWLKKADDDTVRGEVAGGSDYFRRSAASRELERRHRAAWERPVSPGYLRLSNDEHAMASQPTSGAMVLEEQGASPTTALMGGLLLDTLADPYAGMLRIPGVLAKTAVPLTRRLGRSASLAAQDFAPAGAVLGYGLYSANTQPRDDQDALLRYLQSINK